MLTGLLSSSGIGAITGLVGSWLNKKEERKLLENSNATKIALAEINIKALSLENDHEIVLADKTLQGISQAGKIEVEQAEVGAFTTSLKSQLKSTGIKIVDAVRGIMRPLITTYLLIVATILFWDVSLLVGGLDALSSAEIYTLYTDVIHSLLFLTNVSVTWWFGTRPHLKDAR